jgi:hypothetical protein
MIGSQTDSKDIKGMDIDEEMNAIKTSMHEALRFTSVVTKTTPPSSAKPAAASAVDVKSNKLSSFNKLSSPKKIANSTPYVKDLKLDLALHYSTPTTIKSLSLGAISSYGQYMATATSLPGESKHYLIVCNTHTIETSTPITSFFLPTEFVSDLLWIQPQTLVAAAGSFVQIYKVCQPGAMEIKCVLDGGMNDDPIHTDTVCQVISSPYSCANLISTSKDRTLCHTDAMYNMRLVRRFHAPDIVGSVQWSSFKSGSKLYVVSAMLLSV